jgi:hypothetical protein
MLGRQSTNCVGIWWIASAELAQLGFLPLADGRLRHRAGQNLLSGRVEPRRWQGADDRAPDISFGVIELGRRRGSLAGKRRRKHG